MKLPIRLEGGTNRILSNEGAVVAEAPGGFPVAGPLVLAANAYPALVELVKEFIAREAHPNATSMKAEKLLAYLGEAV